MLTHQYTILSSDKLLSANRNTAESNHTTSPGLNDGGYNAIGYLEPHSRGGNPSSLLKDHRRVSLTDLLGSEDHTPGLQLLEMLYPVSRASLSTLGNLTGLSPALVRAEICRLQSEGLVNVEERVDHRGRLKWACLTNHGRQALKEHHRTCTRTPASHTTTDERTT